MKRLTERDGASKRCFFSRKRQRTLQCDRTKFVIYYMKGFVSNIEKDTLENSNFRKVLYTGKHSQLVLMTLGPNDDIGLEVHDTVDQFFRIEKGTGKVVIMGVEHEIGDGTAIIIPAGTEHNIINTSSTDELKLYTVYSPANHKDGTIHVTKAEAEANEEHFDGVTTE